MTGRIFYHRGMAGSRYNWYLAEWLKALGRKQSFLVAELGWNKAKASLTANGKQPYGRDDLSAVADLFDVEPYELLMHPNEAQALRQLKASAEQIATGDFEPEPEPDGGVTHFGGIQFRPAPKRPEPKRRTGTHG